MKFIPLNNSPNISSSRFDSVSPSMQLDSRGFPHIVWLEKKLGHNEVHYAFWDGLQWTSKSSVIVDWAKGSISLSRSGIILEDDKSVLVYVKRDTDSTSLNVAFSNGMSWDINKMVLPYDCLWAGIAKSSKESIYYRSSSSSSTDNESSISSSYKDSDVIIFTYDGSKIRVYSVGNGIFRLLSENNFAIVNHFNIKLVGCGSSIGLVCQEDSGLIYNFFRVENEVWEFSSFGSVGSVNDSILDFDITGGGYGFDEDGVMQIAWLRDTYSDFYVMKTEVDTDGVIDSNIIYQKTKNVQSLGFISGGFSKIAIGITDSFKNMILCLGAKSSLYDQISEHEWGIYDIDIDSMGNRFNPSTLSLKIYHEDGIDYPKLSFCNDNSDVYYLEYNGEDGFEESYPEMVVLNSERVFISEWECGLLKGDDIDNTFYTVAGDILKESIDKTFVVFSQGEDPDYNTSSSSSSSSSG